MHRLSIAVVALTATASADTKSWTALQAHVPAGAWVVGGLDVKSLRAVASFGKAIESVPDIGPVLGSIQKSCGFDAVKSISDVSVALSSSGGGTVVVALDGVDEAKLVACATKLLAPKAKLTAKTGKVSEYAIDDGKTKKTIYAVWPAKDVVVFSAQPEDRAKLDAFVDGKAAQGDLATFVGKANTTAVAWFAATVGKYNLKGGVGTVTVAKDVYTGAIRVVASSPDDAEGIAQEASSQFRKPGWPPAVDKILPSIHIGHSGAEITIEGSVNGADLPGLVAAGFK
jgi:hypothetical protein